MPLPMQVPLDPRTIRRMQANVANAGFTGIDLSPSTLKGLLSKGIVSPGLGMGGAKSGVNLTGAGAKGAIQTIGGGAVQPAPGVTPADMLSSDQLYYDIERSVRLNPGGILPVHFKVYPLPGVVAGATLTFSTQRRVIPFAMITREAEATGTLQSLQAGVIPYFGSGAAVPAGIFSPLAPDTRWLPPLVVVPGQQITATIASLTRACLWCADVDANSPMVEPLRERLTQFGFSSAVGAGATVNVTVNPQIDMRLRRVTALNPGASGDFAACPDVTVDNILVGNQTQYEAAGSIPLDAFLNTMLNGFLDGDTCVIGNTITLVVTNHTGGALTVSGAVEGDTAPASN